MNTGSFKHPRCSDRWTFRSPFKGSCNHKVAHKEENNNLLPFFWSVALKQRIKMRKKRSFFPISFFLFLFLSLKKQQQQDESLPLPWAQLHNISPLLVVTSRLLLLLPLLLCGSTQVDKNTSPKHQTEKKKVTLTSPLTRVERGLSFSVLTCMWTLRGSSGPSRLIFATRVHDPHSSQRSQRRFLEPALN